MTTSVLLIISLSVKTTNAVHAHAEELKLIAKHRYTIFLSNISKIWHALTCKLVNVFLQKQKQKKTLFHFSPKKNRVITLFLLDQQPTSKILAGHCCLM